jgi:alanine-glyoxylate transaminase/serine-glyoxylate transaminase/serine-pyruvate transaminase
METSGHLIWRPPSATMENMENEKLLLIPGPSPVHERILAALAEPTVAHTSPEMRAELGAALENLKKIVFCGRGEAFIVAGAGTLSMEMAILNTAALRDRILILSQGYFGDRMAEICRTFGLDHEVLRAEWGTAVRPERLEKALAAGSAGIVVSTHDDTSTGACAPVEDYARIVGAGGGLFIVDGVCATGGVPERMDAGPIDVVLTAAQKCFGVPPGLAICVFSERAMAKRRSLSRVPAYYSDILRWLPVMNDPGRYFSTPCVNEIRSFYEGTRLVLEEGLESRFRRHEVFARAIRAGLAALGFESFTAKDFLAPTLSVLKYPSGIEDAAFRKRLNENGVVVAGGLAETAGRVFRVGHMGNLTEAQVLMALDAVGRTLVGLGHDHERGAGVRAAEAVLALAAADRRDA